MISIQGKKSTSPEIIWVLGCGKFGRRAVELLKKAAPGSTIIVVDRLPAFDMTGNIEIIRADAVEWLTEHFTPDAVVDKIIPAIPLHLAFEWLQNKLSGEHRIVRSVEIPDNQLHYLPNPIRLSLSRVAMSHADFLCPENCSEPEEICTYTRRQRPQSLYHLLETMVFGNFTPLIVRSRQFAPGVGGFFSGDFWNLLEQARLLPETPLLIGTACKCHGVVDGLCHAVSDPDLQKRA
jgi:hypothetical protein